MPAPLTIVAFGWPIVLSIALAALIGRQDVNISDGGYVLAFSHRLLNGEIPHADFITPKPAGSAYLHALDFAVPLPLWFASRAVAIVQVVAYSTLLAMLVLDRRFTRLGILGVALAAAASVVNWHVFPAMVWQTIDGTFFAAIGFVLLERGLRDERWRLVLLAALALGCAPLMKQSFFLVPLLGLVRLGWGLWPRRWSVAARRFLAAGAAMAVPGVLYVLVTALAGGFGFMVDELTGGQSVWGQPIRDHLRDPTLRGDTFALMALAAAAYLAAGALARHGSRRPWALAVDLAIRAGLTALVVGVTVDGDFRFDTPWSFRLFWVAAAVLVVCSLARRRLDWPGVVCLALGYMVTLSWGAARPAFAAGSLAVYVLVRAWEGYRPPPLRYARPALAVAAVGLAAFVGVRWAEVRSDRVFLPEREASALTARLGGIAPAFKGIRTDPTTAAYLDATRKCIDQHPAKWVAVVPEDAVAAPTFDVRNPFPMDWLWPAEYAGPGSRERIVESAQRLARQGEYLVLVQKPTVVDLYTVPSKPLPLAVPGEANRPFPFDPALTQELLAPLTGLPVTCGPFTGVYQPRAL